MDTDFKGQEKRIEKVFPKDLDDIWKKTKTIEIYKEYLKNNLTSPILLTGIADFPWEEFYILGPGDEDEYEELKKEEPSFTDTFSMINIDEDYHEDYGLYANVRRVSDKKKFQLPLADLQAFDHNSKNYQILDDYSVWCVNY
jgi:hypothetical protein